ncbi:hypothetical protein [Janthinobacterium sp. 17J80-10]|uniref:hypothetical protein n=1 Tax=Janthinobacterium sp. 17J80-10 TaxID=2497863 RepID=UPI00100554EA|nr:hypothetical protein [Janthinobacterium sp. 17J80-10]QAU33971.1 hypothetical protein EKL02_07075 [Janthinobacterium sp. 17J80-10]
MLPSQQWNAGAVDIPIIQPARLLIFQRTQHHPRAAQAEITGVICADYYLVHPPCSDFFNLKGQRIDGPTSNTP